MKFETLPQALDKHATLGKGITFIDRQGQESGLSYQQLRNNALNTLFALQQRGLKQGDYLLFFLSDNRHFIEAFWACLYGGIIPVPISSGRSAEHLRKLNNIDQLFESAWLYIDSEYSAHLSQCTNHTITTDSLTANGTPNLPELNSDDVAFIQFSSGSTHDPKGVILTHRNLILNTEATARKANYTDHEKFLSWMPLTHDMGLIGFHIGPVICNLAQYNMCAQTFVRNPLMWLHKASEHQATILCSPNFGFKHYLKKLEKKAPIDLDLTSVRLIFNGAEPISVSLCQIFLDTMAEYGLNPNSMFTVYGLAEATLAVAFPEPGEKFSYLSLNRNTIQPGDTVIFADQHSPNAVHFVCEGRAIDHVAISIRDDAGQALAEDIIGRVYIQGATVTSGYYHNELANQNSFQEGWLDTGDLGFIDQGQLYITGRHKEIIFSNGLNYYPHDLEAISGIELGKIAFTTIREDNADEDTLLAFITQNVIANDNQAISKIRQNINKQTGLIVHHVVPVQRLPRTTSGKIQRAQLAQSFAHGEFDGTIDTLNITCPPNHAGQAETCHSELEIEIKTICDSLMDGIQLDYQDNFFDSGISSLTLAQIHEAIEKLYPGKIDITDFFENPTIAAIAALLQQRL